MKNALAVIGLIILIMASNASLEARSKRVNQIPNGTILQCTACHYSEQDTRLNPFGNTVYSKFLTAQNSAGNVIWNAELASMDSDGDGFSNGTELQDPNSMWKAGNASPGNPSLVTNPGDATSHPSLNSVLADNINYSIAEVSNISLSPNPAMSTVTFSFTLNIPINVKIDVVSTNGTVVGSILQSQYLNSGDYSFNWNPAGINGQQLAPDMYFVRITTSDAVMTKKFILR